MKKPQEANQEQENEKVNKRTRDPTSPTKNDQSKKMKEHTNQIPVLGSQEQVFRTHQEEKQTSAANSLKETLEYRREIEGCDRGTITRRTEINTGEGKIHGTERTKIIIISKKNTIIDTTR